MDKISSKQQRLSTVNSWLLMLLAFSLPISTSLVTGSALLILFGALLSGQYKRHFYEIFHNPVCIALLIYIALMVFGLLWSEDLEKGIAFIEDRWKLMLMPVFLTVVVHEKKWWYIWAFVAGICVVMASTYLAWFDLLHFADVTPEHLTRKTSHVYYNPLLAFALFVVAQAVFYGNLKKPLRYAGFILLLLMLLNMFITEGRAGQLVFFVLLGLFFLQRFRRNVFFAIALIVVTLPLIFGAGYMFSHTFHKRVDLAYHEITHFKEDPNTSVGLRLLYWKNSWELCKQSPWIGVGTGDFESAYAEVNKNRSSKIAPTVNPHNQYMLVASRFGIVGLVVFFTLFAVLWREAWLIRDEFRWIRFAFPLFFMTIMLTESYLVVYETGFFFSIFAAVLFKGVPYIPKGGQHV